MIHFQFDKYFESLNYFEFVTSNVDLIIFYDLKAKAVAIFDPKLDKFFIDSSGQDSNLVDHKIFKNLNDFKDFFFLNEHQFI